MREIDTAVPGRRTRHRIAIAAVVGVSALLAVAACTPPPEGGGPPTPKAPVAAAATVASAGPAPFSVQFSSAGTADPDGTVESYEWTFGDGTSSTEANPQKSYEEPGTYSVSLVVTDNDGLTGSAVPFTVTAYTPGDASSLVYFPRLSRTYGQIVDKIGVWVCKVAGSDGPDHDPAEAAAWAQAITDEYFGVASRGRYHAVFTPLGTFEIDVPNYTQSDCLVEGRNRTDAPYNNVMVIDTTTVGGGLGGPGYVSNTGDPASLDTPPVDSGRGFIVGGGSYSELPGPDVVVHEIGHTLSFPHSFINPSYQYDNPEDVMSARPAAFTCSAGGLNYQCEPQHTLAFNRWAAGWIDPDQVAIHTGGVQQVDLSGPEAPGTELIVAPSSTSSQALVTIEARPVEGIDKNLEVGGVAVHVEDQRPRMCNVPQLGGCPGLWRRAAQAWGQPNSYDHVIGVGGSKTIHGLTISVDTATATGYQVTVAGTPVVAPDVLSPMPSLRVRPQTDGKGRFRIDLP